MIHLIMVNSDRTNIKLNITFIITDKIFPKNFNNRPFKKEWKNKQDSVANL